MSFSFTCPECGRESFHPKDIVNRYCGACHRFFPEPHTATDARIEYLNGIPYLAGQAAEAMPNGTRVVKTLREGSDLTPLGSKGTVLSSIYDGSLHPFPFYFIEWDDHPGLPVGCIGSKISADETPDNVC